MRVLSSLTNRIFLACMLLATLSLGFAFYFVNARVSDEAEAELRRGLAEAGTLVDQHRATLTDTFTRIASLVADLPKLKAAVATGDPPTVQRVVEDDFRQQVNADLLIVTGRDGQVLGAVGADANATGAAAALAAAQGRITAFWPRSHDVLQIVSVPILIEPAETLGRLTVGFSLDDRLAGQFKDLTGSDIAFGERGHILASTLPDTARDILSPLVNARGMSDVWIGDEEYIALSKPMTTGTGETGLSADMSAVAETAPVEARSAKMDGGGRTSGDGPVTLILRSRTERLRFLNTIRTGLTGVLILTLLTATLVSYLVARTMTLPLGAITNGMREIATTGDLTRKVTLQSRGWDDEDARLLASTFNTLTESIARFQAEATQRERLSSLGRLSTVIAHEIRNPLMIIKTALNSLRRERLAGPDVREAVADIDEEITRLNRIVTEVLDFARPIRFEYADTSINTVCTMSAAAATAGDADASVLLDLDAADPHIVTDAERLRTALVNIVSNARNAVASRIAAAAGLPPEGGSHTDAMLRPAFVGSNGDAPIRIETQRVNGERVRISVIDRGPGIAPDDLARVFEPYFTTRRTGTGLGLPIARNIIEGLGGTIDVTSQVSEGTRIDIELPSRAAQDAA